MQRPFFIRHEVLPDVNCQLRGFDDDVDVFSQMISPVHGLSVFRSTDQIVHHFNMSRKSKSKDQTKALNILFTLTQGDLLQEALAVTFAKDQTQSLNIPVKVPLGGGRYAELTFT
jgi:hypothetical protein